MVSAVVRTRVQAGVSIILTSQNTAASTCMIQLTGKHAHAAQMSLKVNGFVNGGARSHCCLRMKLPVADVCMMSWIACTVLW